MARYRIIVLPGDGAGREVVREALRLMRAIEASSSISFDVTEIPCGGQYWLEHGEEWPAGSFERCRDKSDAILLGAIGWPSATLPNGDIAGGEVILGLRAALDLYANVRPIKLYEGVKHKIHGEFRSIWKAGKVDMVIVRENTEGLYHSLLSRSAYRARGEVWPGIPDAEFPDLEGQVEWDPRPISSKGSERVIRFAFDLAKGRDGSPSDGISRVTCIDKSNVTRGCQLFRRIYESVAEDYPNIEKDTAFVDAFTMWLIRNPEWFDVCVTPNMFGDITTDLASVLQGGMGMAASANIGDNHMLFEPVHGSAPKHAGKDKVNPIATLSSVQLMLDWLGRRHDDSEARSIAAVVDQAIGAHLLAGDVLTYDLGGDSSCSAVGMAISGRVTALLQQRHAHV